MPLFDLTETSISEIARTTFERLGIRERYDLQRLLRDSIQVIDGDLYVVAEEFGEWEDAKRRIDLLCLDRAANLVVVELKRTEDGGHMELQALRYAAMVSTLSFEKIVESHAEYLRRCGRDDNARDSILHFLGLEDTENLVLGDDVRIMLVAADFSREVTTTVLWLNERDLDIRCIRVRPYQLHDRVLVDVQQVLPLPEASDYEVKVRERAVEKRAAERRFNPDFSKYNLTTGENTYQHLTKRALGFRILHAAVSSGISPEELSQHLGKTVASWLITVDGTPTAADFAAKAAELSTKFGKYQLSRFFCGDEDLVRVNGKTYAITNQWSINHVPALRTIAGSYPELKISFVKAEPGNSVD
jgi:hypothetical protein